VARQPHDGGVGVDPHQLGAQLLDLLPVERRRPARKQTLDPRHTANFDRCRAKLGRQREQLRPDSADEKRILDRKQSAHVTKLRSTNPLERVNREIGRRTDVVGIFPNDRSLIRVASPSLPTRRLG
jgi:transposase-like protein